MKTALLLVAFGSAALACSSRGVSAPPAETAGAAQYRCPMHPQVVQDRKGECPICGMDLVRVADAAKAGAPLHDVHGAPAARAPGSAPGAMAIGADKQKVIGVVVSPVEKASGTRTLRVLGRVAPDEKRVYRINAGIDGSIRDVTAVTTGSRVRKDELLATFYAPNALSTIQLFLMNVAGKERLVQRHTEGAVEGEGVSLGYANIQQRIMQLENIGVSALQREEIARTRVIPDTIKIFAPANGFVLARNVTPEMKFDRGTELYRIADLRRVWVLADVFLHEARHVRRGMRAQVSVPEQQRTFPATVAEILPQFDATTRTLKVRLEVDNPDFVLRPDMFVDVGLSISVPAAVAIPADAIIDSGLKKTVFVQTGEGVFEARNVETGWRLGDEVEIVKGLSPGDQIVTSGTFFLDSESRMRPPVSGAAAVTGTAPVPTGPEHPSPGGAGNPPRARERGRQEEPPHAHAGSEEAAQAQAGAAR